MEIAWRVMDKVPDEWKLPHKLFQLKHTPDGKLLWRKAYLDIKHEYEENERLKRQVEGYED
jgi:hypothetical protein